ASAASGGSISRAMNRNSARMKKATATKDTTVAMITAMGTINSRVRKRFIGARLSAREQHAEQHPDAEDRERASHRALFHLLHQRLGGALRFAPAPLSRVADALRVFGASLAGGVLQELGNACEIRTQNLQFRLKRLDVGIGTVAHEEEPPR